jgi:hypothetical protein
LLRDGVCHRGPHVELERVVLAAQFAVDAQNRDLSHGLTTAGLPADDVDVPDRGQVHVGLFQVVAAQEAPGQGVALGLVLSHRNVLVLWRRAARCRRKGRPGDERERGVKRGF